MSIVSFDQCNASFVIIVFIFRTITNLTDFKLKKKKKKS